MTTPLALPLSVCSDRLPDGSYSTTLSLGQDVSWSLAQPRATKYAAAITALAVAAEHDAATYAAMRCRDIPDGLIGDVIARARTARADADRWTAPLVVTPMIAAREPHPPILACYHRDRQDLAWQWTPNLARQHAMQVLNTGAAAILDATLAAVLASYDVPPEVGAAVVNHLGHHWPTGDED